MLPLWLPLQPWANYKALTHGSNQFFLKRTYSLSLKETLDKSSRTNSLEDCDPLHISKTKKTKKRISQFYITIKFPSLLEISFPSGNSSTSNTFLFKYKASLDRVSVEKNYSLYMCLNWICLKWEDMNFSCCLICKKSKW
jgi:hypothetical protein